MIELTNVHTGQKEVYEDTNLVTEAVMDILNTNILGILYDSTGFNNSSGDAWKLPLKKNIMGAVNLPMICIIIHTMLFCIPGYNKSAI